MLARAIAAISDKHSSKHATRIGKFDPSKSIGGSLALCVLPAWLRVMCIALAASDSCDTAVWHYKQKAFLDGRHYDETLSMYRSGAASIACEQSLQSSVIRPIHSTRSFGQPRQYLDEIGCTIYWPLVSCCLAHLLSVLEQYSSLLKYQNFSGPFQSHSFCL